MNYEQKTYRFFYRFIQLCNQIVHFPVSYCQYRCAKCSLSRQKLMVCDSHANCTDWVWWLYLCTLYKCSRRRYNELNGNISVGNDHQRANMFILNWTWFEYLIQKYTKWFRCLFSKIKYFMILKIHRIFFWIRMWQQITFKLISICVLQFSNDLQ